MASGKESLRMEQQQRLQQRLNIHNVVLGRMLEMSAPEFDEEVRRQLDDNPALEALDDAPLAEEPENDFRETAEQLQMADYADDDMPSYRYDARNGSPDDIGVDAVALAADESESAFEILLRRLAAESELSAPELKIGSYIIGNLDSNGYLTRPLDDIADDLAIAESMNPTQAQMQRAFDAVRHLDPAGIGAVDLRDCLLLQLDRRQHSETVELARRILTDHFDLFSKKHYDRLAAALDTDTTELGHALDLILSLNPRPAAALEEGGADTRARHITPDFVLDYDHSDGIFTVQLAGRRTRLGIEDSFTVDPKGGTSSSLAAARAFIRSKRDEAATFIRLAELRADTLTLIAEAIVKIQHEFFATGDRAQIKPMILKDVSAATGLDLSVISRAVAGKYMLTPHGMYPLKFFFNEHPKDDSGASAHRITEAIRELIEGERKKNPLSDQAIQESLQERGFDIARRTVAKYRERLGYPVARLRKTYRNDEQQ
ncbi:MAG: RNA polymerase factor sigma-54 [Muribaculaceae bacterium]|nr:RNA polymerase factor sigma-54 [Muribaculaceae bacterium]